MMALEWVKSQVLNILAPSYSAHLDVQRQKVAENATKIRALKETQEKYRVLLGHIGEQDVDLGSSLTELGQNALQVEQARQGVVAVVVEQDAVLEKAWPQVEQEMLILLRWIKFNEPGGVLGEVDKLLERHHRTLSQGLQLATVKAQVDRAKQEAGRLTALHQRAASVADDLHDLAGKVAEMAAKKSAGAGSPVKPLEVLVKA